MIIPASIPAISTFNPEAGNGVLWFIMLYCTGAYFRKYPPKYKISTSFLVASGLLCFSGIMGELISRVSIWAGFEGKGSARFSTFDSFPIYGAAVAIFCAFLQLAKRNIQSSKMKRLILFFSCSSFSAYLIHEHPSVRKVLWSAIKLFQYEGVDLLGLLIVSVVVIFCSC